MTVRLVALNFLERGLHNTQKQYIDVVLILAKCIILKSYCYLRSFVKQDCACQKVVDYQYNITNDNQPLFFYIRK